MAILKIQPTVQAQWYELIHEAHQQVHITLSDDLDSYLIALLIRFTEKPDLVNSVVALEYLQGQQEMGEKRREQLRDVGDKCLLFSGLFPGRASRASLKVSHFVDIGQSAYGHLSELTTSGLSVLFRALSYQFVSLMDILQVIRDFAKQKPTLTPIEAYDLWVDTNSQQAKRCLKQYSSVLPILVPRSYSKH